MVLQQDILDKRIANFIDVCRSRGVKVTPQRLEIFKELATAVDHPDAEQIFQRVRKRLATISLDTVYRSLWLLNDLGLVATLGVPHDRNRFDANLSRHHHFICRQCGYTRDFYSKSLDQLPLPDAVAELGRVEAAQVEVRGLCRRCEAQNKKS